MSMGNMKVAEKMINILADGFDRPAVNNGTSFVSRGWWAKRQHMPDLILDEEDPQLHDIYYSRRAVVGESLGRLHLMAVIDRLIMAHKAELRSFTLRLSIEVGKYNGLVKTWLRHVCQVKKARKIHLDLQPIEPYEDRGSHRFLRLSPYRLQFRPSDCSYLEVMELKGCYFESLPQDGEGLCCSMRSLNLGHMVLPGVLVSSMVGACPMLESLTLENCYAIMELKISAPRLIKLTIKDCYDIAGLEIEAPNLQLLEFPCCRFQKEIDPCKLFRSCPSISSLQACPCIFTDLGSWNGKFYKLGKLKLQTSIKKEHQLDVATLLDRCPLLRSLIIDNSEQFCSFIVGNQSNTKDELKLPHLQRVKISPFFGATCELELLECLLRRAPLLSSVRVSIGRGNKNTVDFYMKMALFLQQKYSLRKTVIHENLDSCWLELL